MAYFPIIRAIADMVKAYLLNRFNCFTNGMVILSNIMAYLLIMIDVLSNIPVCCSNIIVEYYGLLTEQYCILNLH